MISKPFISVYKHKYTFDSRFMNVVFEDGTKTRIPRKDLEDILDLHRLESECYAAQITVDQTTEYIQQRYDANDERSK